MIDIHAHILPDLDDGPADDVSALKMALQAVNDGITTIIATPHVHEGVPDDYVIAAKVKKFNALLKQHSIPLDVLPGAEMACDGLASPRIGLLNNGPYMLIEFPHGYIPSNAEELFHSLQRQGVFPVVAHPERNAGVIQDPHLLLHLLAPGVYLQITAASLLGASGSSAQQCALYLLRQGVVHFLATDCHSPTQRRPELSRAYKIAAKIIGKEKAGHLVNDNPLAVVRGTRFS
ncbi:MAG: hypothetical protein KKD63_16420 [Proteobacteria bacterium]|nr:hypothetical protein [Desulfobulbaceae bacterium]MBU4154456.1 hypothetical protein [Pseudomonadota bacterium]MDP2107162.1 CpsB/CapC family capsule biosynthesis tyrosine phosphatase [Desulfobulbaceae bacterium]